MWWTGVANNGEPLGRNSKSWALPPWGGRSGGGVRRRCRAGAFPFPSRSGRKKKNVSRERERDCVRTNVKRESLTIRALSRRLCSPHPAPLHAKRPLHHHRRLVLLARLPSSLSISCVGWRKNSPESLRYARQGACWMERFRINDQKNNIWW